MVMIRVFSDSEIPYSARTPGAEFVETDQWMRRGCRAERRLVSGHVVTDGQ